MTAVGEDNNRGSRPTTCLRQDGPMMSPTPQADAAQAEVIEILQDLIRIDSTNDGTGAGPGEAAAAEYVEARLVEVGLDCERFSTTSSRRQGVVARIAGTDANAPALLLHGHLDVVPAQAADWAVPPFGAEVVEDMVWGRGAVDMKDMDAMLLSVTRAWVRDGVRPRRDLVLMYLPDEEAGGHHGSHWIVDNRPDMLEGVSEGVSEVGGFSLTLPDQRRLYLIQSAEKGIAWMRLTAEGRAGHGSVVNDENAVTEIAAAVTRIGRHEWPPRLSPTAERMVQEIGAAFGFELDLQDLGMLAQQIGPLARFIGAGTRNVSNPTMLTAGYKANVIPGEAAAMIDGRFMPGDEEEFFRVMDELLGPNVRREFDTHDVSLEADFDVPLVDAMRNALQAEDPECLIAPYVLSGGTDAKAFSQLGVTGYGFAPLRLPPDLDFGALFHGVDERVPIDAVHFGVRTLDRFLRAI
jgi:acetylornithine deacetylase/succinyl-diaminopimelate desuccinylase-like protein